MADAAAADEQLGTAVLAALGRVIDPEIRRPVTELDMIRGVDVQPGGAVCVDLQLTIVGCPAADTIERDVRVAAGSVDGVSSVTVDVSVMAPATRAALTERLRAGRPNGIQFTPDSLTRVIAVTSGKGVSASRRSPPTSPSHSPAGACGSGSSTSTCTASASPG